MFDDYKNGIIIRFSSSGPSAYDKVKPLKIGQQYEFSLNHYVNGWANEYQLVSSRIITASNKNTSTPEKTSLSEIGSGDNKSVATSTSVVAKDQPVKQSFVSRFISWFFGLFVKKQ